MRRPGSMMVNDGVFTRRDLERFVDHCDVLEHEARQAIRDAQFRKRHGTIYLAVDFSEVFALIFPTESAEQMKLFPDDTPEQALFQQRHALDYLFFRRPEKLLLLPPHALELQSFIIRMRSGLFADTMKQVMAANTELARALENPEAEKLRALAAGEEIPAGEVDALIEFFNQNVGSLMALADESLTHPFKTINRLIADERFMNIDVIPPEERNDPSIVASDMRRMWYDRLVELRHADKEASSFIDSIAMATIRRANQRLRASNCKVHFVTRSKTMHHVFEEQYAKGLWEDAGGHILRHPRQFTGVYGWEYEPPEETIERMQQRRSALRYFLNSARLRLNEPGELSLGFDDSNRFRHEIGNVQSQWHLSSTRDSQTIAFAADAAGAGSGTRMDLARRLLRVFTGQVPVGDLFQKRLAEMTTNIDRQQQFIAWLLQSDRPQQRQNILDTIWIQQAAAGTTVLASRGFAMPYTLRFRSAELQEWALSLESNNEISWDEIVHVFRDGFGDGRNAERLLAMAYFLGAIGRWQLAEECCEMALGLSLPDDDEAEVKFFLAVCKRNHAESPRRYREAITLLDEARQRVRQETGKDDARYIREQAAQIIRWNRDRDRTPDPEWRAIVPPPKSDGLALLELALEHTDDPRVLISIRNGICYYYCEDDPNPLLLESQHNALVSLLSTSIGEPRNWPPLVTDTVVWARYRLRHDPTELKEGWNWLADAARKPELRLKDRAILSEHLHEIRAYLQNPPMAHGA